MTTTAAALSALERKLDALVDELRSLRTRTESTPIAPGTTLPERILLEEAAGHAGMAASTLRGLVAKSDGRLGEKIRGRWVIRRDPFLAYLEEQGRTPRRLRTESIAAACDGRGPNRKGP